MCRLLITTLQHCSTIRLIWYSFVTPQKNSSQSFRAFSPHRIGKVFHFHGVFLVAAKHRASIDLLICRLLKSVGICEHKMRERGFLDFGGAKNTLWKTSAKNGGLVTWFMWPGDSVQVPYWKTKFEFLHNFPEVDCLLHWRLPWEGSLSQGKSDVINIHSSHHQDLSETFLYRQYRKNTNINLYLPLFSWGRIQSIIMNYLRRVFCSLIYYEIYTPSAKI